jgi:hypothetical protein
MAPTDVAEFVLARIAEDEALAAAVPPLGASRVMGGPQPNHFAFTRSEFASEDGYPRSVYHSEDKAHFLHHTPARVLAQCTALRAVVAFHKHWVGDANDYGQTEGVLQLIASIWSGHPDYDPQWVLDIPAHS